MEKNTLYNMTLTQENSDCPVCKSRVRVAGEGLTHWYVPLYFDLVPEMANVLEDCLDVLTILNPDSQIKKNVENMLEKINQLKNDTTRK